MGLKSESPATRKQAIVAVRAREDGLLWWQWGRRAKMSERWIRGRKGGACPWMGRERNQR